MKRGQGFLVVGFLFGFITANAKAEISKSELPSVFLEEVKVTAPASTEPIERTSQEVKVLREGWELKLGPEKFSSLQLRERGEFGVQQDLSIRGSTFEQNLVVFEGIRLSDPQTGHHLMNLPFTHEELSSIEVLAGGASALYGPGGFGGAVNFNLKKPEKGVFFSGGYGSYDLWEIKGSIGLELGKTPIGVNLSQQKSNGFIWNRDFDIRTFNLYLKDQEKLFFYGFQEKDFGAKNFYTTKYDTEWEETRTHLFLAKKNFGGNSWFFEPTFLYRIHYDTYLLDRRNPDFYKNTHKSQVLRTNLPLRLERSLADYVVGMEASYESLDSSRLGDHVRQGLGAYFWVYPKIGEKVFPSLGVRYDSLAKNEDFFSYYLGLAYLITPNLKTRTSFSFSYRAPSFTELYYDSPYTKGNPSLDHEKAYNVEAGLDYKNQRISFSGTVFYRIGKDIIDWIKKGTITQAQNIEELKTFGTTLDLTIDLAKVKPFLSYTYLNQVARNLGSARYQGAYFRHNLVGGFYAQLPGKLDLIIGANLRKPYRSKEVYLVNVELKKQIKNGISLCLWGKNLLDEEYEEIKGVKAWPQTLGIKLEFKR
ncbi:TonB-dependent receptor [Thermodesulfobacterium sp. TA1]|uniref:TonB-dependent receptor plug domain-containing protein n=1 Tax=Thermodesulfobacterium sp. TA1 TaxID=2234087 RepID=UPI001232C72B|nr:TonB-dependent receptor [Thermodesulfobacterium sp. TA1]QER41356.1 TonB-dependent receptor [Thermodesulfobacterium sp. TA1]